MKNTVLVNICENAEFNPFGFWYMSEENATSIKYLAGHDNKRVIKVYEVHGRYQVDVLKRFDKNGIELPNDRKLSKKWVFRTTKLNQADSAEALKQLATTDLYQVQGVKYTNIELCEN